MTIKEAIGEIYRIARLAPLNADSHDQLHKLYEGVMGGITETPAPANVEQFPQAESKAE